MLLQDNDAPLLPNRDVEISDMIQNLSVWSDYNQTTSLEQSASIDKDIVLESISRMAVGITL